MCLLLLVFKNPTITWASPHVKHIPADAVKWVIANSVIVADMQSLAYSLSLLMNCFALVYLNRQVGLPNVGKSTLFNTLTKLAIPAENFPFCTIEPNEARVNIPDERFEWLCQLFKPKSEVCCLYFLEPSYVGHIYLTQKRIPVLDWPSQYRFSVASIDSM